jgi:hypothetical protein
LEYLGSKSLSNFFERFCKFDLPGSVIESLSFVCKSENENENRFVHKNRLCHSSETKSVLNSIPSLSQIRIEFETLKIEHSNLKSEKSKLESDFFESKRSLNETIESLKNEIFSFKSKSSDSETKKKKQNETTSTSKSPPENRIEFLPSPNEHRGLFNFLRQQCNGENPHLGKMIKVSASHSWKEHREWNVLDLGTSNYWCGGSDDVKGQWIDFDLLGRSFTGQKHLFAN